MQAVAHAPQSQPASVSESRRNVDAQPTILQHFSGPPAAIALLRDSPSAPADTNRAEDRPPVADLLSATLPENGIPHLQIEP